MKYSLSLDYKRKKCVEMRSCPHYISGVVDVQVAVVLVGSCPDGN